VEFANTYPMMRAWAVEGTGGHGPGLSRHMLQLSELVVELDRPKRSARRNGAKSDPLDAIRAAREAMARPRRGTPRSGGERQALSVLLTARRSAVNASTEAQLQLFSTCRCASAHGELPLHLVTIWKDDYGAMSWRPAVMHQKHPAARAGQEAHSCGPVTICVFVGVGIGLDSHLLRTWGLNAEPRRADDAGLR
jgi:hypothetical protein